MGKKPNSGLSTHARIERLLYGQEMDEIERLLIQRRAALETLRRVNLQLRELLANDEAQ